MSIAIFIIGIVIGGIATLVSVVFAILSLVSGKKRNAGLWGAFFALSLCILIFSVVKTLLRVGEKVKTGIEWAAENGAKFKTDLGNKDDSRKGDRQAFLDTLKANVNEKFAERMPAKFYENKPADSAGKDAIIVPFLFPYSIKYNTSTLLGDIISDNDSVYVPNITQLAFDKNFVIAKVDNSQSKDLLKAGHGEVEYIFFDMRTGNYESFVNMEKMLEIAGKIGYTGSKEMRYLSDDYNGWIEYPEYD